MWSCGASLPRSSAVPAHRRQGRTAASRWSVLVVRHDGIRAREEESFVLAVLPAHDIRRSAVVASHLKDHAVAIVLSQVMALDDDLVALVRLHDHLLTFHCQGLLTKL